MVRYNKKQNRRVVDLRWKKRGRIHAIRSSIAITKLLLGHDILKKKKKNNNNNNKKEKCNLIFFFFPGLFLNFSGLVVVHTASLLAQEHIK